MAARNADLEAWRAQLDHLRPGRRAVAYDPRGHGGSEPARDGVYTVEAMAADLDAVIRDLGLRRVVLVGHSFSGTVLTAWAGAHPDSVAGLVYVDAVGDFRAVPREAVEEQVRLDQAVTADVAARQRVYSDLLGPVARPATRERVLASADPTIPNRVLNLETGSLAVDAALKLVLARFYTPQDGGAAPKYARSRAERKRPPPSPSPL